MSKKDFSVILAIDTSSRSGSIALVEEGRLVAERNVADAGPHAGWLLGNISGLCSEANLSLDKIDLFAAAVGPGSFTGLRIGLTTIKGLAWALGKPVAPVCTLRALAMNADVGSALICPILDARKSEVYTALYSFTEGRIKTLMEPLSIRPEELLRSLQEICPAPASIHFLGNGLGPYGELLREGREGAVFTAEPLWNVRAANIAALAALRGAPTTAALELTPLYLRKSEAELRSKTRRNG